MTGAMHNRSTIVAAVVALSALATVAVVAVIIVGVDASSTPVLVSLFGFLAPTLVALLALLRTEHVEEAVADHHTVVDERLASVEGKVDEALNNSSPAPPPT